MGSRFFSLFHWTMVLQLERYSHFDCEIFDWDWRLGWRSVLQLRHILWSTLIWFVSSAKCTLCSFRPLFWYCVCVNACASSILYCHFMEFPFHLSAISCHHYQPIHYFALNCISRIQWTELWKEMNIVRFDNRIITSLVGTVVVIAAVVVCALISFRSERQTRN